MLNSKLTIIMLIFISAIQSLSALNEQILICAFPNENTEKIQIEDKNGDGIYRDAVKVSLGLMRGLLLDAQVCTFCTIIATVTTMKHFQFKLIFSSGEIS